jgi:hypothetical protein
LLCGNKCDRPIALTTANVIAQLRPDRIPTNDRTIPLRIERLSTLQKGRVLRTPASTIAWELRDTYLHHVETCDTSDGAALRSLRFAADFSALDANH